MRPIVLASLLSVATAMYGQATDTAKQVYSASQDSVFLIYLNDSTGTPSALGSAFLVAPRTLITNAHVANAGVPFLAVGPVRLPLKVVRLDEKNDLAVLSVDVDLTSKPLPLASENVTPGEQVFAIGNPEGLEKTISQGIVSGLRKHDDRNLLQVTTPISHGSSGGPILNAKGEVVGVAVGMLEGGQNLNFAVPVALVKEILVHRDSPPTPTDASASLSKIGEILEARGKLDYSDDPTSEYQNDTQQALGIGEVVVDSTTNETILARLACLGVTNAGLDDVEVKAARKLVRQNPSAENRSLLAYVTLDQAQSAGMRAQFAEKGSDQQTKESDENKRLLAQASDEASEAGRSAKGKALLLADYVLGVAKLNLGDEAGAIPFETTAANGNIEECGADLAQLATRDLVSELTQAKRISEAEKWFALLASKYEVYAGEWDLEGDRRAAANEYSEAADAYEKSAEKSSYFGYDYCYAANDRYFQPTTDPDAVLSDGRKCVDESIKETYKGNDKMFDGVLPVTYRLMADVLNSRGVYQSALEYIKESLSRRPDDAFSLDEEAKILENLQRSSECVVVAQQAIRNSDGKFAWMNFTLGNCYFDSEDWAHAEASFRIAAEADKNDASSAFDLGLSLLREGYGVDARTWFQEALRRKPDDELREKILRQLN